MTASTFIPISADDLRHWEKILRSGLRGTHVLFTNEMIREAFSGCWSERLRQEHIDQESLRRALSAIARSDQLHEKQLIIENLDPETRAVLVHMYFGLLEQMQQRRGRRAEVLN